MSDVITKSRGSALARASEAMLRALGGGEVIIRCPVAPAGDAAAAELGIVGPVAEDLAIAPVVTRNAAAGRFEFLFAPSSLTAYLADRGESPEAFFTAALGIVHGQTLLHIETMTPESFAGTPYLFRVIASE